MIAAMMPDDDPTEILYSNQTSHIHEKTLVGFWNLEVALRRGRGATNGYNRIFWMKRSNYGLPLLQGERDANNKHDKVYQVT